MRVNPDNPPERWRAELAEQHRRRRELRRELLQQQANCGTCGCRLSMEPQSQSLACIYDQVLYCPRCIKWAPRKHRAAREAGVEPKPGYMSLDEWQGIRAKDRERRQLPPRRGNRKRSRRRSRSNASLRERLIQSQPACAGCQRILVLEPATDPAAACLIGTSTLCCPTCAGAIVAGRGCRVAGKGGGV